MSIVRLGEVHLDWCDECNLPIVEEGRCGVCGKESRDVDITPPGDVRPAFEKDIESIREIIDRQWGDDYSYEIIPADKIVILNGIPYIDKMDEVIVDGQVVGTFRYNVKKKAERKHPYEFIIRPWNGLKKPEKGCVVIDDGAVKPISDGASVLAPGIVDGDTGIEEDDEVMVVDKEGRVICAGSSHHSGKELINNDSGRGVKNRWRTSKSDYQPVDDENDWDDVLKANEKILDERVEEAVEFIKEKVDEYSRDVVVAYSGGKDSLATLHLVMEAGFDPRLLFIDTGIELPETIENVKKISEKHDLELKMRKAHSGYWSNLDHFGPSARDHRWCCKTCKLGPTARLIDEDFDEGILSFIGQRRYESTQRMNQGNTWNNPWVPGQRGASPIQDWTALHVWLYLFRRDAEWNPWYEEGFERIGCWVCPASDLAELDKLKDNFGEYYRLEEGLEDYAEEYDLPEEWIELGLWRWKEIPDNVHDILDEKIIDKIKEKTEEVTTKPSKNDMLQDNRTKNLINILRDIDELSIESLEYSDVEDIYRKAKDCVECGICVVRCEQDALYFDEGVKLDEERCIHCRECLGKCPVVDFSHR
ncbi:MAG: phosphoadenosine phosphosulfate reductase family protein [Thermoplasmatota archaeon]